MIKRNQILKTYGTDYKDMTVRLLGVSDLAAVIRNRCEEKGIAADPHSACIGIKPNLVVPSPAEFGGTTHTEVVAGIIEYLQAEGFGNLLIAEGSWVGDRTAEAYEYCGYRQLCERYGVPFVDTQKERSHEVDCGGMRLKVVDTVDRIDFLINVPVMKGHCQTLMTCALKNLKGLLPNPEKSRFHRMGLHKPIAHLQKGIRQDFIVVDHICGDLDFEEGGNPVVRNCVMTALDPVLVDSYACHLMGYTPDDVPYVRMAEQLGIGTADLSQAEILHVGRGTANGAPDSASVQADLETDEELPRSRRVLDVAYAVEEVDSCSACYANLTGALIRLEEEGLLDQLDTQIGIGQGMQGRTGRLGVGRCTKDFDVCIMGCPPSSDKIYEGLRKYILEGYFVQGDLRDRP